MISRKVQYAFSLNYHISKTTVDYTRKKDLELVRPIYICIESVVYPLESVAWYDY